MITLVVLVTVIHIAAFVVMSAIRLWPARRTAPRARARLSGPALCAAGQLPHLAYDGLDPDERRDPPAGRAYSTHPAYYQPLCAAH